jgi:nucleoside-diphosphate-sugar epimerase
VARRALESRDRVKVAITGAAGYVGSLLVHAHAARGDSVHATGRSADSVPALPGVTRYGADIVSPGALPDEFFENTEVFYHCAAEVAREPLMRPVNVEATRHLLARARGRIGHWVQVSSLSVYGTPRAGVVDETTAAQPRSTYARTKHDADVLVAASAGAFSHTIVRPSAVIGRGVRTRSIHALIEAVARGRFCFIGARGAIGNYIHEENLVEALLLCATHEQARGRTYIVSQNCTIEDMIGTIASEIGSARRPHRLPEALARVLAQLATIVPAFPLTAARVDALTSRVEYRTDAIERDLGYRHRASLEDALRELAARWEAGAR